MAHSIATHRRAASKSSSRKGRRRQTLQKPNGVIGPRVKKVGADRFAIVCIDPAKDRSEWLMADYYGNLLIEPQTVEHRAPQFQLAAEQIRQAQKQHGIRDMIVTVERTGRYHLAPQRSFAKAGWEVRIIHPFATKQYRLPADAGNKTDHTDLFAQHRAAVAGFGLCEPPLPPLYQQLQLRVRHRRDLIEKSSALACQVRDHLHLTMPRYAKLFAHLLRHPTAMCIAKHAPSPTTVIQLGLAGIRRVLQKDGIRFQQRTIEKVLAWAQQAESEVVVDAELHHAIWTDLYQLYDEVKTKSERLESDIAGNLAGTPYIRLLAIPGIHVVSAADFAGEMGPISHYANANAITGRSGLFPSRYQSDQTDRDGCIVRTANRRLRASLMRIADNLAKLNTFFQARVAVDVAQGTHKRAARVKIAKHFSRLAMACVAGEEPLRHPCCRDPNSILEKLRAFHYDHDTPPDRALVDLEQAVGQLPLPTQGYEAGVVAASLAQQNKRRCGPTKLGELLPSVLARLKISMETSKMEPSAPHTQPEPNSGGTALD